MQSRAAAAGGAGRNRGATRYAFAQPTTHSIPDSRRRLIGVAVGGQAIWASAAPESAVFSRLVARYGQRCLGLSGWVVLVSNRALARRCLSFSSSCLVLSCAKENETLLVGHWRCIGPWGGGGGGVPCTIGLTSARQSSLSQEYRGSFFFFIRASCSSLSRWLCAKRGTRATPKVSGRSRSPPPLPHATTAPSPGPRGCVVGASG